MIDPTAGEALQIEDIDVFVRTSWVRVHLDGDCLLLCISCGMVRLGYH